MEQKIENKNSMQQNPHWENFYEKAWEIRRLLLQEIIQQGIRDPFMIIQKLNLCEQNYEVGFDTQAQKVAFYKREFKGAQHTFPTGKPCFRALPIEEHLAVAPFYKDIIVFLLDYLGEKKFEAIVELGCGLGHNLIELFYRGGPQNIPYYGGEYTESGVNAAKMLAQLRKELPLIPFRFDYKNPNLSIVKEKKNLFIFTSHSIEQVSKISPELFYTLTSAAEQVTCIHFEPFGFQFTLGNAPHGKISEAQAVLFKNNDWNTNLIEVLTTCQNEGILEITFIAKNVMGETPDNPTSIAIWEKRRSKTISGS